MKSEISDGNCERVPRFIEPGGVFSERGAGMGRDSPDLWILRHGETAWNVEERLQGHLDSPLTETGLAQANAQRRILARVLPGPVPVLSSPSGRALRTARIVADAAGMPVTTDEALRELYLGAWQGRRVPDIRDELPGEAAADPHLWKFTAPGGERLEQMIARLNAFLDRLDGPAVVVTHGLTSRVLRCLVLGLSPRDLAWLPGGQGVVHHLSGGRARVLGDDP